LQNYGATIEQNYFNFRDTLWGINAQQYGGLEDFMNAKETQVNNTAHFSLFMVTFSRLLPAKIEGVNRGACWI